MKHRMSFAFVANRINFHKSLVYFIMTFLMNQNYSNVFGNSD